jgi:outer membrane lipoprotein-sorting protein
MRPILVTTLFTALCLAVVPAHAEKTVDEILKCLEANAPATSAIQTVTMRSVDRTGAETEFQSKIFWRKFDDGLSRVLIRVYSPPNRRGSALLLIEQKGRSDIFMYLPDLRKTKRVSKRAVQGSMFGTDLTYEDFERIQGMAEDSEGKRLADAEVDGRPAYVLEFEPARGEESEYERIVLKVDQERCVPIQLDHFEAGDRLRKQIAMPPDKVGDFSGKKVPQLIRVKDLVDGTHTDLVIEEIELDVEIPEEDFSSHSLEF